MKLGAGRLSFFQSLEPADSCSGRPGAAAATAGHDHSHILEEESSAELMRAHEPTSRDDLENKDGLDKEGPGVYSICPLVLIFEESLCG